MHLSGMPIFGLVIACSSLGLTLLIPSPAYGQVRIEYSQQPPARVRVMDPVMISWRTTPTDEIECRTKLDVPGDWAGGIRYALNKWSAWGTPGASARFSNFVVEGTYEYEVECRSRDGGRAVNSSLRWQVYWEYPEIREEAFRIDWRRVNGATGRKERLALLADEYRQAHMAYMEQFRYQHRLLKLTTAPDEIVRKVSGGIVGGGQEMLLDWADESTSVVVQRILLPRTVYELLREGLLDLVLIYRNYEANKAASMAIGSYYAWQTYAELAR